MSVHSVITEGFGSFGSVGLVVTEGFLSSDTPSVIVTTPGGGSGYPVGPSVYWQNRGKLKKRKLLDENVTEWVEELYAELTAPDIPKIARREAGKVVKEFADTKAKVPQPGMVDWQALSLESRSVQGLIELWRKQFEDALETRQAEEDEQVVMMLMEHRRKKLLPLVELIAMWMKDDD